MRLRNSHLTLIRAWAALVKDMQADGYRGHLMQTFRFGLEEALETDCHPDFGAELRRQWSHAPIMSVAAREQWLALPEPRPHKFREMQRQKFVGDHAIPLSVTARAVMAEGNDDRLTRLVLDGLMIVMITKNEDRRLNAAGLRRSMPPGWTPGNDPLARYHAANIEIERNPT